MNTTQKDIEFLRLWRGVEGKARRQIYKAFNGKMRWGEVALEVEEVLSDVMSAVHKMLVEGRLNGEKLEGTVYKQTEWKIKDYWRRRFAQKNRTLAESGTDAEARYINAKAPDFWDQFDNDNTIDEDLESWWEEFEVAINTPKLHRALAQDIERAILERSKFKDRQGMARFWRLSVVEGMSQAEAGRKVGISPGTARQWRLRLRRFLADRFPGPQFGGLV